MRKLILVAGIAAMALALTGPFALAQTVPNSDTSPSAASSRGNASGPAMMYDQAPGQPPGQTDAPGQTRPPGQTAGYGPGTMFAQGQGGYGAGMMSGYGMGWMGGYGGIWVPILLAFLVGGLVVWVVTQKAK